MTTADRIRAEAVEMTKAATKLLEVAVEIVRDGRVTRVEVPALIVHGDAVQSKVERILELGKQEADEFCRLRGIQFRIEDEERAS